MNEPMKKWDETMTHLDSFMMIRNPLMAKDDKMSDLLMSRERMKSKIFLEIMAYLDVEKKEMIDDLIEEAK